MAVGDTITAARYNNLQARIATVLGTGSGTDGYGQTLASSTVSVGATVNATDMQNLYDDMVAARVHQTGSIPTSIADMVIADLIAEDVGTDPDGAAKGYADFESLMPNIETDKFLIHPSQASVEAAISSSRVSAWNGTLTHEFTVTFNDADARRHFFNSGGEIRFTASLGSPSGAKDNDWATMLANMGTVKFGYTATTVTGSGTGSAIGNYDLTGSYQNVFNKTGSGLYAENDYNVQAREVSTSAIQFRVIFQDDDTGDPGTDENVTGTLTSTIQQYRATGVYVEVDTPAYSNNTTL